MSSNNVLTQTECEEIIRLHHGNKPFEVLGYSAERFSETVDGFLTDNILIKIKVQTGENEQELRFFGKQFPDNKGRQNIILDTGAFSNEIFLYELLEKFEKETPEYKIDFAPKFYFGKEKHVLVFEDLSIRGFTVPQRPDINKLDVEHIYLVMGALGKFHAASIAYEERKSKELGKKYRLIDEYSKYIREAFFGTDESYITQRWSKSSLNTHLAFADMIRPTSISREEYKNKLSELAKKAYDIMKPSDEYRNTLCHGDLWAKNVLFRYENDVPVECKLIDFQLIRYLPPAHDALHFIYLSTDEETRQLHFHQFLNYYYKQLRCELAANNLEANKILPYEEFRNSINYLLPQVKLQTAYYRTFQGASSEFHKKLVSDESLYMDFTFGNRVPYAVELFNTEERYRNLVTKAVHDLQELFAVPQVTKEDCYEIIEKKIGTSDYTLLSYSTKSAPKLAHFLWDYFWLTIKLEYGGKQQSFSMLGKSVSSFPALKEVVKQAQFFKKEVYFHEVVAQAIKKSSINTINNCVFSMYFYRLNDVIVYDSVGSSGYKTVEDQLDNKRLSIIAKKLANLHASSLLLEDKISKSSDTTYRLPDYFSSISIEKVFTQNVTDIEARIVAVGYETVHYLIDKLSVWKTAEEKQDLKARVKKAFELSSKLSKPSQKYTNVICHGNLCLNSILIKEEGQSNECCFTGFHAFKYLPPAYDLLSVLYFTINKRKRRKYAEEFLNVYFTELEEVLQKEGLNLNLVQPREKFFESIECMRPLVIIESALNCQFATTSDDLGSYITSNEIANETLFEDRRRFIDAMCERSAAYKSKLQECVLELEEICDILY